MILIGAEYMKMPGSGLLLYAWCLSWYLLLERSGSLINGIVGVCAFSPVILFYFLRSGTYWEGAFSVPPYIELTVLLLASVLSFIAFYVQYRFNKMQKKDIDKERAENVFFKCTRNISGYASQFV